MNRRRRLFEAFLDIMEPAWWTVKDVVLYALLPTGYVLLVIYVVVEAISGRCS